VQRHAPFGVVVGDVERLGATPGAAGFFSHKRTLLDRL
jgi:hypothetical protein